MLCFIDVQVTLKFTYVESYPDEAPLYEIVSQENLEDSDASAVLALLAEQAQENLGMVMIFTLVSAAQDKLNEIIDQIKNRREEEKIQKEKEVEEAEKKRFHGTPVTIENFLNWKAKFDVEMVEMRRKRQKRKRSKREKVNYLVSLLLLRLYLFLATWSQYSFGRGTSHSWSLESCLCDNSPTTTQRRCSNRDRCLDRCSVAKCDASDQENTQQVAFFLRPIFVKKRRTRVEKRSVFACVCTRFSVRCASRRRRSGAQR
ncbi:unnamed protein product [Ranitomeya imitator]|uniref:RWD domain-containing protein n=1 Tax=Ranitomeya imitator TaxID=111125 RepID=A0ABN9MN30_9NEOB|nr:unnamed protein product [Ranitomeya imitator]